jgi:hypothetical protein
MKSLYYILILLINISLFSGCKNEMGPTVVKVEDSVRHYFPIIAGGYVRLSYKVKNVGQNPFIINDIQPSCGCIMNLDSTQMVIFPGDSCIFHFIYNSTNNLGFVRHTIRIYGNVIPNGEIDLSFDINVIPSENDSHDFEQIYGRSLEEATKSIRDNTDQVNEEKDYWVRKQDDY